MIKDKKKFIKIFVISFAVTAALTCFMLFVLFRGIFYNIYKSKGNTKYDSGSYSEAIKDYNTARSWKGKKQEIYLLLAKSYIAAEDYDSALGIIDEAIDKKITTAENGLEELYIMRIRIMTANGNLIGAVQYTDTLDDQYILKKIQSVRPGDLTYTPTQGSYDKTLKMEITVRDNETVYYTIDGSYPTKYSNIYVQPINIGIGTTTVNAVSVNSHGLVSPLLTVTYEITNENQTVSFDDEKIEAMVRMSLSKPVGKIRVKELESITELNNDGIDGYVRTLSDLDLMPNLEVLILDGETNILSLSQISGKTKLNYLSLANCNLDSTEIDAIGGLPALQSLYISNNSLTSLSALSNLTVLKEIDLSYNNITDISALTTLKELTYIDVSGNRINELPDLACGENLETLIFADNSVSDLSTVHNLKNLLYLDISNNSIRSAKNLSALTKLETLFMSDNPIANFDFLKSLTTLGALNVSNTSFVNTDVLSGLKLNYFYADNTGISDLSKLKNSETLVTLSIANTNVTDISPVKNFKILDYLNISNCSIDNLAPLSEMQELYTLCAAGIDLTGITFKNPDISIFE